MTNKTQKEKINELFQAVIGIPENPDDNGLIGDIRDIKKILLSQNTRIRDNERRIYKIWGILIGLGAIGGSGLGIGLSKLIGG